MKLSKIGKAELEKKFAAGKIPAEQMEEAQALINKRNAKAETPTVAKEKKASAKKKETAKPKAKKSAPKKKAAASAPKKKAAKKEKVEDGPEKEKSIDDYQTDGISGLVRKLITPKDGSRMSGCSFGEAKKEVLKKYGRALYPSEFDRNFKVLKTLGVVDEKRPPRYKPMEEVAK